MSIKIREFIKEMRDLTNELYVYSIEVHENIHSSKTVYKLSSSLSGLVSVEKETEEELEAVLDLERKMITQLIEVKETKKRIDTKLLNSYPL